jgi:peptide/histidine transporter 3/4
MEKPELVEGKVDWHGKPAVKHKHGGVRATLLILATFGFESMATLSLAVNLTTYFNGVLHYDIADAANQLTNFMGTNYILSLVMAAIADTWLGRFKTCVIAGCLEFLGLALLTIQAHYPNLRPPVCNIYDPTDVCKKLEGGHATFFFFALYFLAIGSGGVKAALPPHGADQFDDQDPREAKQMSSYFNNLLLALCIGGAISLTFIVWIQDNKGWDWGFGIGAIALCLGLSVFLAGLPLYRMHVVKKTTALVEIAQVYVAAIRNQKLQLPEDSSELYEIDRNKEAAVEADFVPHTDNFRFLDKAAIQMTQNEHESEWKLCRVTQVENAKIILAMVPIFGCTIIMTLCLAQLQTFSVQQGITMDTSITKSFKIPPASLPIIPVFMLIIIIPIYDRIIVPSLRKITKIPTGVTHLQRIGVGLVLSCISMAIAGILEVKRKDVARDHNMINARPVLEPLPISVFWLSFQYFVFGIADMFTYVGLLEFFYSEAPKALKSVSSSFLWSSMAVGYYSSSIVVSIVNKATKDVTRSGGWLEGNNLNKNHLNLFYWMLSLLSLINFFVYLFVAKRYKYRPQVHDIPNDNTSA